jgi:3-dehydroquinate synthase
MILDLVDGKTIDEIRGSLQLTEDLIAKSVSVKAQVVSSDFKEGFEREILNYGHTFGHAVELHSNFSLRHGECVSIGMAYIAHLSSRLGLMDITTLGRLLSILRSLSLPVTYSGGEWPDFYAAMKLDKKSRGKTIRFVAVSQPGKTQRLENLNENDLIAAYEKVRQ